MLESELGVAAKLRSLGTFEEYFWLVERKTPRTIVVVAALEGPTTIDGWRTALNALQAHHPILSARVRKSPGFRPCFVTAPGVDLPLEVLPFGSAQSLLDYCAKELETGFAENELLLRATVLHEKHRSTLVLAADHVAFDGRSLVYLIRDLISSLAGKDLGKQKPFLPSLDELLGLHGADIYSTPSPAYSGFSEPIEHPVTQLAAQHQLEQISLAPQTVAAITERARQEQTTVHGALTAGILIAGRAKSQRWAETAIRCVSPIDNRKMLGIGDIPGVLLTLAHTELESAKPYDFWDLARQVRSDVSALGNIQAAARSFAPLRETLSAEMAPSHISEAADRRAQALMVTNYGRLAIPSEYGPLRLLFIRPMITSGVSHTQTVSLATLDGLLCMTNVSAEPISDLLIGARDLIISQLR
ncbi:hypothetical protein AWM79_09885 [Pseudomonas agarici]|uniref:Phthiocerol/phthiodiolone dimycocerosyl transferase n=1 Tax=Pseudomonas agarici TaxID=46677 RepID=A0A0X1T141_PSEAA|nr:hypothetical protein [Pseudomonas agarici]AMB85589.1 hypothetical protein AWM79_09885 [Pseudomonas agarici]